MPSPTSVKMMKKSFARYVLLVLCLDGAVAQIFGPQTQFNDVNQRRQLSPQQQGHILSDIQQHQHRFNLHQNVLSTQQQVFPPQQFGRQNQFLNKPNFLPNQQLLNSASNPINSPSLTPTNVPLLNQQVLPTPLVTQQSLLPTNQPGLGPGILPTAQTSLNPAQQQSRVVQHHTQTGFTPNFQQQQQQPTISPFQIDAHQHLFQVTSSPLFNVEQFSQLDPEKQKERLKELKEKQAIIDKHNQYVERQYEKALKKAQTDHSDFVKEQQELKKKLYQRLYRPTGSQNVRYAQGISRFIYPEETELFNLAVKKYYEEHPTTTTTTTTTTTPPPPTTTTEKAETEERSGKILNNKNSAEIFLSSQTKLYSDLKAESQSSATNKKLPHFSPTVPPATVKAKPIQSLDDLDLLQKQYKSQQIAKDDLIAQLRLAIGENSEAALGKNLTSREISLPNGQKVEIIRTTDPKLIPGAKPIELDKLLSPKTVITTAKPPKELFDELTKGVVPPGANFEILKHENGGLAEIGGLPSSLPNQKKVTFVLLEEQNDGSFKVQGVRGNGEKEKDGVDVDSILKRIKDGEIKLPPPSSKLDLPEASAQKDFTYAERHQSYQTEKAEASTQGSPTTGRTSPTIERTSPTLEGTSPTTKGTPPTAKMTSPENIQSVTVTPNSFASSELFSNTPLLTTNTDTHFLSSTTPTPTSTAHKRSSSTSTPKITTESYRQDLSPSHDLAKQASTLSQTRQNSIFTPSRDVSSTYQPKPTISALAPSTVTIFKSELITPDIPVPTQASNLIGESYQDGQGLAGILKKNGLYAMAKFLRQSGLDTILNETGPYTIFAPNDKAFRTLLVQLGGPDKAEEKFKDNPRLLSGLLLHHVIPGAFKIGALQDEMTGVSLAGTQLRVNQYNMHDVEWNDVKITTINGAKVLEDKQDIDVPQGVAHGVDRVMFPLPVGDIVQTLQSDRERRFTSFLRALFSSGLAETLQGTKTFTLFAPTDRAFAALSNEDLTKTVSDRTLSRDLVMRHIIPGTLYTNGMRYYQIKESLEPAKEITLSKTSGKVKVNNVQIATQNIPTTNGVIHAIDAFL